MKVFSVSRDIAVIALVALVGFQLYSDRSSRAEQLRAEQARLSTAMNAISKLEDLYKEAVFDHSDNKGIYHQMFRQNEILIEYNKLLLTTAYLPAPTGELVSPDPPKTK